ncbi:MAG: FAD-binding oxidoreductase [Gemmatimonadota bacterium]
MTLSLRALNGDATAVQDSEFEWLRSLVQELITPESPEYDEARAIWNGMIDRRPGLIARCQDREQVAHAVRFARDHELLVAVRGGGHNIAGNAVCDGGLVIDLSTMTDVEVDQARGTVRVQPGCTLADVDRETQAHGLAVPLGINSTTGISGLVLGGGFGWLSRQHGMTVDNLLSAEVVTADGQIVRASETENPDLFWGIRGGGGNFGVVTSFELRLHQVGPEVLSGLIVHPFEDAADVLRFYREFASTLPDETVVWVMMRKAPPLPFLPEEWHGREVVVLAAFHGGEIREGEKILEPLRRFGRPIADVIGPHPYTGWQQAVDPLLTPGARNYWKSHDFLELNDAFLDTLIHSAGRLPSSECEIFIAQVGGAINRVAGNATAYPHREAEFIMNVHARWSEPSDDGACTLWARDLFREAAPHATGGVYVNFMPEDERDRMRGAYGPNYERLVTLKTRYDPTNLFRMNQNIEPEGSDGIGPIVTATPVPA